MQSCCRISNAWLSEAFENQTQGFFFENGRVIIDLNFMSANQVL